MASVVFIGLGSGLASALLFVSLVSGSPLAVALFYLAPLPVFIVSLGWPHWSGLVATLAGTLALAFGFSTSLGIVFLIGVGLPAWWLSYLTLLASADENGAPSWYPLGRLVLWAAAIGTVLTAVSLPLFTGSLDYQPAFRASLDAVLRAQLDTPEGAAIALPNGGDPDRFLDFIALLLPPMAALSTMLAALFNLWAGARIVRRSGRLPRPWPDIAAGMAFPRGTAALLGIALLASLLPGLPGLFAELATVTVTAGFTLLGFAVLHVVTRGVAARPFILAAAYLLILLQAWLIFMAVLGLCEQLAGVRARIAARRASKSTTPPSNRT